MKSTLFKVITPRLSADQTVAVCGSVPELGSWNPMAAPAMSRAGIPMWSFRSMTTLPAEVEFKFIIRRGDEVIWEEGENRTLDSPGELDFRGLRHWRAAGVAVPVFSLRSDDDFGCGDFADLRLLVDWAAATGQQVIQILPINDTTMTRTQSDSYPYSAISSYAIHLLYLRPSQLGELQMESDRERFESLRLRLNEAPDVDYPAVVAAKEEYARIIYKEQGVDTLRSAEFADFVGSNAAWLLPYCAYCVLRDNGELRPYSPGLVADVFLNSRSEAMFYAWLQYHLHVQLLAASRYARSRGVSLKGDIPIGVSAGSVDAWQHPELFNLDSSAGAPPDVFARDGQNWGFPTYNWERMAEDGFAWWRARLSHMAQYFDAYRIDHVLGFFRIWEIPAGVSSGLLGHFSPALPLSPEEMESQFGFQWEPWMTKPLAGDPTDVLFVADPRRPGRFHPRIMGYEAPCFARLSPDRQDAFRSLHEEYFYRRHNDFWRDSAMLKLPALVNATGMLACAEDLGMIPACVPGVLDRERILALEVQRMPKQYGVELAEPSQYSRLNVATTSTHDMEPLRLWLLKRQGEEPTIEKLTAIIRSHTDSPAMLAVLPLQDWLSIDQTLRRVDPSEEQINVPANPNHYWRYRMHLTLESLLGAVSYNARIRALNEKR